MEGKYPLLIDGRESGELRVTRRGALTLFEAEAEDGGGILRLSVYGGGREGYLGVMSPSGEGRVALRRQLSRAALRDFPYGFAQRRFRLAQKPMPDEYSDVWRYAYGVPVQTLKVMRVEDAQGRRNAPFTIGQTDGSALLILCDQGDAMAVCTVDVEDTRLWDELFVEAMAYRLALYVAVPLLKNNSQKLQELAQLYQGILPSAEGQSASEQRSKPQIDSWLTARGTW